MTASTCALEERPVARYTESGAGCTNMRPSAVPAMAAHAANRADPLGRDGSCRFRGSGLCVISQSASAETLRTFRSKVSAQTSASAADWAGGDSDVCSERPLFSARTLTAASDRGHTRKLA